MKDIKLLEENIAEYFYDVGVREAVNTNKTNDKHEHFEKMVLILHHERYHRQSEDTSHRERLYLSSL